jgi:tetratricopeptide (TPR) repeat protein
VREPALTDDITPAELDSEVRRDLRGLQRDTAESVARHLVAAGRLVDEDPARALEHARFARARASRIAVVREAAGIAAYHAGEWAEALGELRAARRMGGGPGHLAVMADIERALGRPERALELSRGPEVRELGRAESIELAIVAAGARRDLGELDAAVVSLQVPELDPARRDPWSARLFYAYADNLLAAGRESDALQWFVHAADVDDDGETDAGLRIAQLTGEPLPEDEFAFGEDDEPATSPDDAEAVPDTDKPDTDKPDTDKPDAVVAEATETTEAAADAAEAPIDAAEDEAVEDEAEAVTDADADAAAADAGTDTADAGADADDVGAHTEPGRHAPGGESAPADGSGADAAGERGPGASG